MFGEEDEKPSVPESVLQNLLLQVGASIHVQWFLVAQAAAIYDFFFLFFFLSNESSYSLAKGRGTGRAEWQANCEGCCSKCRYSYSSSAP